MTTRLLYLEASPRGPRSLSVRLADDLVAALGSRHPDLVVTRRDLTRGLPLPPVSGAFVDAIFVPPPALDAQMRAALALSDLLVEELVATDIVVMAAPMYNYSVPANLKAWIDHIVRPGLTFNINGGQYEGLLKGKTAYVVTASGGVYSEGPGTAIDFHVPYLKHILGFVGISDVRIVRAEAAVRDEAAALAQGEREVSAAIAA